MSRFKGLYILAESAFDDVYAGSAHDAIAERVDLVAPPQTADSIQANPGLLAEVDVIFSGWGAPLMDAAFLAAAPHLDAVFYGAGSVRYFVTEALWNRDIRVTSAARANAVPVAEYTLATILFSLKQGWALSRRMREEHRSPSRPHLPGAYGSLVGLVGLGLIGAMVRERLRRFDLEVAVCDPWVTSRQATALNVRLLSLPEIFQQADLVSLHVPLLPATTGMITGRHIALMKPGATFINTARGALVLEAELVAVLSQRPDLQAVLDVTDPEPPLPDSPLYTLPNVVLTPHIAGALDGECRRMGDMMAEELDRYIQGMPLLGEVRRAQAVNRA